MTMGQMIIAIATAFILGGVALLIWRGRKAEQPRSTDTVTRQPNGVSDPIEQMILAGDRKGALKKYCEENNCNVQQARRAIKQQYGYDV